MWSREPASGAEPIDPFEPGERDRLETAPGAAPPDHLRLEETDDRLGERVVVAVADGESGPWPRWGRASPRSDRRGDPGFGEPLGVSDPHVLRSAIAVADEAIRLRGTTIMDGLLEGVEDEVRLHRTRDPPADGEAGCPFRFEAPAEPWRRRR
jgi:hypothetical protein